MSEEDWYHHWFLNNENPETLYITAKGHSIDLPSFRRLGHSKQISWLEKKLDKNRSLPIEDVFYFLDIHEVNRYFSSGWMKKRMNANIGMIGEGSYCKIRELIFDRVILDSPKLVLFHDYLNRDESDESLRRFVNHPDGSRNTNFLRSIYVGNMIATSSQIRTLELVPPPLLLDEQIDYTPEIEKLRADLPKNTLGDVLGPLLNQYKK